MKATDILSKVQAAEDREAVGPYPVPEWDVTIWFRPMSGGVRSKMEAELIGDDDRAKASIRIRCLIACACDEDGNNIFNRAHEPMLASKSGTIIGRLSDIALKVSGMGGDSVEEAKKDSSNGETESSSSGSQKSSAERLKKSVAASAALK